MSRAPHGARGLKRNPNRLGSLDQLLEAEAAAKLMRVPQSWIYANADEIPGVLRLGRYVRFRPAVIRSFL
jgi:hypothetical protein